MTVTDTEESRLDLLCGQQIPDVDLESTSGQLLPIATHPDVVIYLYPGASGTIRGDETPLFDAAEHHGFRDHLDAFATSGFQVIGVSSQSTQRQRQIAKRAKLAHALASDPTFSLAEALGLPTLRVGSARVYERITLVVIAGWTREALLPLPTPGTHPASVAELLQRNFKANQSPM
jgi:peroxiredoxin